MNKIFRNISFGLCTFLLLILFSCTEYTPKPRGYFRIEIANPVYDTLSIESLPYAFEISNNSKAEQVMAPEKNNWINLNYPSLNATLYCSYMSGNKEDIMNALKDSYKLAGQQQQTIVSAQEKSFSNPEARVFGSLFLFKGDCISPIQFHLTDSTERFFRGALYYHQKPNADSIAPVTQYLIQDISTIIETFNWKE